METAPASTTATPRVLQELTETLQRLRLGGPFYVLLWGLAGLAGNLWERARWPFLVIGVCFIVLTIIRFRVRGLPKGSSKCSSDVEMRKRLDAIWMLLLVNTALWGGAAGWLLLVAPDESARTVAAVSSYAFATAFAHNFPMRLRQALLAIGLIYLPTLAGFMLVGSRVELVAVSALYLLYVVLALRRSHVEYLQRLDLEDELRRQRDLFEQQSRRDGLTGLANRRLFSSVIEEGMATTRRHGDALVLMILDLDHFKVVNDSHGHAAGDICLRGFARQLQQAFDNPDEMVARLGGEEFAVVIHGQALEAALDRAEAFRIDLVGTPQMLDETSSLTLAVSIGVAVFDPARHADVDAFYRDADAALYRAKELGRNRVCTPDIDS
ncbi:GGDEF domain-containing protein [Thermomonas sp.]|uniref:GGDEF domain-containing protein n=1 Tax=Thermomonas sp. TaxID=1971895 RepID=UPI00248947B2|nr:GGDEF domain-containing protein [Thermomonas sp.]MDI1251817.1 GGDEF domain-containing protein [Thermomonas sp.]